MRSRLVCLSMLVLSNVSYAIDCPEFVRNYGTFTSCGGYSVDELTVMEKAAVLVSATKVCQGVLVADGFVLTSDHCLGPKDLPEFDFSSGFRATATAVRRPFTNGQDLVLLELAAADFQAAVAAGATPARIRPRGAGAQQLLMLSGGGRMFFRPTAESDLERIRYFVDSVAGDSGSPIYDSDGFLMGIHSYGSYGADPCGAVYLTPMADGRVSFPGAMEIAELAVFDSQLDLGANTTLYGTVAVSAAANFTYLSMEVDGVVVPELVTAIWPENWWPAAYGTFSFFIPNRLRDGRSHEYRIVAADPITTSLGPNAPSRSNVLVLNHHLPTGTFILDPTTNRFVLQYSDPDSSFSTNVLPRAGLRACPGLSGQCDYVWLNSSYGTFPNAYTFRYEAVVPSSLWLGGQTLSGVVFDNEDVGSTPPATVVALASPVSFDVGYPIGSIPAVAFACSGSIITAIGTAQAVQPGYASLDVGLYVDNRLAKVVKPDWRGNYSISFGTSSGSHPVSVQAFNPVRPTPPIGSVIGTPTLPTYSTVLFLKGKLSCK